MSLAWMGRRAVRYLIALGLLDALRVWIVKPQPPRVGYAEAIAGIPVNRTVPPIGGDLRLGGVATCGQGVWDTRRAVQLRLPVGPRQRQT